MTEHIKLTRSIAITPAVGVFVLSGCDRGGNTTRKSGDISAPARAAVRIEALPDSLRVRTFVHDQLRVATLGKLGNLSGQQIIDLAPRAGVNVSGIDFSDSDTRLHISTQANDVPGTLIDRLQEVLRVELDGSNQVRLTTNSDSYTPSTVPRVSSAP